MNPESFKQELTDSNLPFRLWSEAEDDLYTTTEGILTSSSGGWHLSSFANWDLDVNNSFFHISVTDNGFGSLWSYFEIENYVSYTQFCTLKLEISSKTTEREGIYIGLAERTDLTKGYLMGIGTTKYGVYSWDGAGHFNSSQVSLWPSPEDRTTIYISYYRSGTNKILLFMDAQKRYLGHRLIDFNEPRLWIVFGMESMGQDMVIKVSYEITESGNRVGSPVFLDKDNGVHILRDGNITLPVEEGYARSIDFSYAYKANIGNDYSGVLYKDPVLNLWHLELTGPRSPINVAGKSFPVFSQMYGYLWIWDYEEKKVLKALTVENDLKTFYVNDSGVGVFDVAVFLSPLMPNFYDVSVGTINRTSLINLMEWPHIKTLMSIWDSDPENHRDQVLRLVAKTVVLSFPRIADAPPEMPAPLPLLDLEAPFNLVWKGPDGSIEGINEKRPEGDVTPEVWWTLSPDYSIDLEEFGLTLQEIIDAFVDPLILPLYKLENGIGEFDPYGLMEGLSEKGDQILTDLENQVYDTLKGLVDVDINFLTPIDTSQVEDIMAALQELQAIATLPLRIIDEIEFKIKELMSLPWLFSPPLS